MNSSGLSFTKFLPRPARREPIITEPARYIKMTTFGPGIQPPHTDPHTFYLRKCLALAERSPPRPTNFRVGAILVSRKTDHHDPKKETGDITDDRILSSGYTMELAGNTHAEQCCLANLAAVHGIPDDRVAEILPYEVGRKLVMYVTMEPCGRRLSGNTPCVQRIVATRNSSSSNGDGDGDGFKRLGIEKVYFGVKEPGTFVGQSEGCKILTEAGIEWELVSGLEREILQVAVAGHENRDEEIRAALGTDVDDISVEERRRQEQLPRNPKKRMMEVDLTT
ncbi:hypothetical protein ASPZODRAFT_25265 [Penicilliopsis zonata CBS 506.65]|uniref:CMP/dCMP-type deaminase domain-containing protein n=1 Tax=Penicilliopsis zonata CBS 506.65 TaxID=1073090 RepID=A0A1L9SJ21_9EURO|nr:hypothetical protein ASPZODRAFT_25265 [Penicilliopsis zonata CBS 506.65]OJJ47198.1 hypothetical protein ASPZODRAFT_25265 [Penicilliopsis zonata CBS 506.65]